MPLSVALVTKASGTSDRGAEAFTVLQVTAVGKAKRPSFSETISTVGGAPALSECLTLRFLCKVSAGMHIKTFL